MNTEQTEDHTAGLELKPRCGTFAQIMMGGQRKSVNPIALPVQHQASAYTLSLVPNKIKRLKRLNIKVFVVCLSV